MALAPNTGFGLLNPGTTTPPAAQTATSSPTVGDILGSFAGYNATTDQPLPGSEATNPGGFFPGGKGLVPGGSPSPYLPVPPAPTSTTVVPTPTTTTSPTVGSFLNADPAYLAALARQHAGLAANDAALNQARQQAIIQFGDPALAQMAGFGLDPQAGAFAQQSYLSGNATLARIDKAHKLAQQAIINQLAAHGLLNSGELGYEQGQENQNYGNNVYDAQQAVLQRLTDLYNSYLNSNGSLEDQVNSAMENALSNYIANPDAYTTLLGGGNNSSNSGNGSLPPGTIVDQGTPGSTAVSNSYVVGGKKKTSGPADALSRYLANRA